MNTGTWKLYKDDKFMGAWEDPYTAREQVTQIVIFRTEKSHDFTFTVVDPTGKTHDAWKFMDRHIPIVFQAIGAGEYAIVLYKLHVQIERELDEAYCKGDADKCENLSEDLGEIAKVMADVGDAWKPTSPLRKFRQLLKEAEEGKGP